MSPVRRVQVFSNFVKTLKFFLFSLIKIKKKKSFESIFFYTDWFIFRIILCTKTVIYFSRSQVYIELCDFTLYYVEATYNYLKLNL